MKKIFLISLICLTASCTYVDRKVKLDIDIDQNRPAVVSAKSFEIMVIDERKNKEIVGTKKFGDQKVKISTDRDLSAFLQNHLAENLLQKGFKLGTGKTITLVIKKLEYTAIREFIVGRSQADLNLQLTVKNNQTGKKFTRSFEISVKNKHFIAPTQATDAGIINGVLEETVQNILDDEELMKNLAE